MCCGVMLLLLIIYIYITLKKVYDRNVVNKYLLLGVIIYYLIDYIYICMYIYIYIYIYIYGEKNIVLVFVPRVDYDK